jgi:hypothetical protein
MDTVRKIAEKKTDRRNCFSESHSGIWGIESTAPIILGVRHCQLHAPAVST